MRIEPIPANIYIYLYNVGKTIINHPYVDDLYHLSMDISGDLGDGLLLDSLHKQ
jgi:hypothetical protein